MKFEIISNEIHLIPDFSELLSLRNITKATRHDDLLEVLDNAIAKMAERRKE